MNLHYRSILLISVVMLAFLSGCIKDNLDDCFQGVNVRFYSMTPCQIDTTYPGDIKDITLCVFDKNDVLVSTRKASDISIGKDYSQNVETPSGLLSAVAWSGLKSEFFDVQSLKVGSTTKHDLLFRLKRAANSVPDLLSNKVYYGESPAIYVPETDNSADILEYTSIDMQEITNRIRIYIEGLPRVSDYEVEIESNNGSMNLDGSIAQDNLIKYSAEHFDRDGMLDAYFTLLKLDTGHSNTLVIRSKITGTELYRGSLLGTLLLKNPDINLACDHDFIIKFTTKDQCSCGTYMITEIWVNNWLVHSYDTEM